ncbi:PQ loop repeat protein [Nadsonia fulvescens var. elongata DSM 6958]|uniref:PQ loop repeat protein n=1 Tax=Nadsonia fulvescens var. elongata DSM 6958 TaxID=857566 RepID=A0A1E3PDT6_9ASCO|nr:PQ loop repeat protein [Nadsonia fulvescens var. elongata DSM 6958]
MECSILENPSLTNFTFSLCLALGIFISYLPQHIRIVRRKTSEGISPLFILLGVLSGTSAFFNVLLLSRSVIGCCSSISFGNCLAATLGVTQVGVQAVMMGMILILCVIFTRNQEDANGYHHIQIVSYVCATHLVLTSLVSMAIIHYMPQYINSWATILGVSAAILTSFQFFPQIITTYKLKHVGSLSMPMMFMQTPGGFAWAASLAAREGTNWSSWITYFTAAFMQGILLVMAVYFEYKNKDLALVLEEDIIPPFSHSHASRSEETPLLN